MSIRTNRTNRLTLSLAVVSLTAVLATGCSRNDVAQTGSTGDRTVASVEDAASDTLVTTKVKTALLRNQDTKGLEVHVETHQGIVQLTGTVESQAQSDTALVVARAVEGVKSVENNITSKGGKQAEG